MKVARVIVDVPVSQTDKPFDYLIPEYWEEIIQPGMRVVIPFGVRMIQGFVIEITDQSNFKNLKPINRIMDIHPVLTEELLQLGFWLTKKTLCIAITAFQVMLPTAMKVKYEKVISLRENADVGDLPKQVSSFFKDKDAVQWKEFEENPSIFVELQKLLKEGMLDVQYRVKDRAKVKEIKRITTSLSANELQKLSNSLPTQAVKQKKIIDYFIDANAREISLQKLLSALNITSSPVKSLIEKGILNEQVAEVYRDPYKESEFKRTSALPLTNKQQKVIQPILGHVRHHDHSVFLLYGITGSGKTEIYLQSIAEVIEQGKEAIVLVPEISLTPMMVNRFKGRFGSKVAVLHSGLSAGEKYDEWRKIQRQEVKVVVGARSAIFAPFTNLGIIIIDEEHESSYKQEDNPRYHARDVAIYRGEYHQCPVILGSATPTLESYARAKKGVYRLLKLDERINGESLPKVEIVDMREELKAGNRSMFSGLLFEKLSDRLTKNEQTVLLLNRRGYSTFVMCRDCGSVIECPHCDISLTYHKRQHQLKCHYCGFETGMPNECPECASEHIRFFGTGTQKVEEELAKVLPQARVIRMDVDTTRKKGSHEKLLSAFADKEADILLGTQMIAKGLDFPEVTLVGVLAADMMLHIPDFRASERTFQLLTQVSGRAGRHHLTGEVIVQTYMPEHYSIQLAQKHDYENYYLREMLLRKQLNYPPYYFLAMINVSHSNVMEAMTITDQIASYLKRKVSKHTIILGPVASQVPRIKDRYRYQCMIKYKDEPNLNVFLQQIIANFQEEINKKNLQIHIDLNPYMMT